MVTILFGTRPRALLVVTLGLVVFFLLAGLAERVLAPAHRSCTDPSFTRSL